MGVFEDFIEDMEQVVPSSVRAALLVVDREERLVDCREGGLKDGSPHDAVECSEVVVGEHDQLPPFCVLGHPAALDGLIDGRSLEHSRLNGCGHPFLPTAQVLVDLANGVTALFSHEYPRSNGGEGNTRDEEES